MKQSAVGPDPRKVFRPWLMKRIHQEARSRLEEREPLQRMAQRVPLQRKARQERNNCLKEWWNDSLEVFGRQ